MPLVAASVISFRGEINPIVNLPIKLGLYQSNKYCYSTGRFLLSILSVRFTIEFYKVNLIINVSSKTIHDVTLTVKVKFYQ